jgi:hypothetical protein
MAARVDVGVRAAISNRMTAEKTRSGFSMADSTVAGVQFRHLAADNVFWPEL